MIDMQTLNDTLAVLALMVSLVVAASVLIVGIAAMNAHGRKRRAGPGPAAVADSADESRQLVLR
jgi:hypothetical protein